MSSPVYGDSPGILARKAREKVVREREAAERYEYEKRHPRRIPRPQRRIGSTGYPPMDASSDDSEPEDVTPEARQAQAQFNKLPLNQKCKELRKERSILESWIADLRAKYWQFRTDVPKHSVQQNHSDMTRLNGNKVVLESQVKTWNRRWNAIHKYHESLDKGSNQESLAKWLDSVSGLQIIGLEFSVSCAKIAFEEQKHPGMSDHQFAEQQAKKFLQDFELNTPKKPLIPLITPSKSADWLRLAQNVSTDYRPNLKEMKEMEDAYAAYYFNSKVSFEAQATELFDMGTPKDTALEDADYLCRDLDVLIRHETDSEKREKWLEMLEKIDCQRYRLTGCVWISTLRFYTAAYENGYEFESLPELTPGDKEASGDEQPSSLEPSALAMEDIRLTSAIPSSASAALPSGKARTSKFVESGLDTLLEEGSEEGSQGRGRQQGSQQLSTQSQTPQGLGQGGEQQQPKSPRRKEASRDLRKQADAGASWTDSSETGVATAVRSGRGKLVDTASRSAYGSPEPVARPSSSPREPEDHGDWAADDNMPAILAMIERQELEEQRKKTYGSG